MRVAVACDHGGFPLKAAVIESVRKAGHDAVDLGTNSADPVDYPDYAKAIGEAIQKGKADRGILLCGSGVGASVAANKMRGIRAAICHDVYSAHQGVEHDDMNVMALGGRVIGVALAQDLVASFLGSIFSGEERHARRLEKIKKMEIER